MSTTLSYTVARLQNHLRTSRACREQLWGRGIRYGVGSGIGSQDVSLAEQAHDGLTPVLRAEGPQPDLQPRAMQAHDDDVAEIVVTAMDEAASMDVEEMTREVVRRVEQHPIAWTEFKKVLIMLRDGNVEHDAAMFGVTVPLLQEVLRRLAQPTTWNAHYRRCKTHDPRDMQYTGNGI